MIQSIKNLYESLSAFLKTIEDNHYVNEFERRKEYIKVCTEKLLELKELVLANPFDSKEDEIYFFKELKPLFVSPLVYYKMVDSIELAKPAGAIKALKKYYRKELAQIELFFNRHTEYYRYFRSGAIDLDEVLFLRGNAGVPKPFAIVSFDFDPQFSTGADYILTLIMANEELKDYLNNKIRELNGDTSVTTIETKRTLRWTGPKVHLVELAYALFETGQINNGGVDVSVIAKALENFFNVKLGLIYHPFQEIRLRKRESRTKYIDMMREGLLKRMDDLDA